MIAPKYSETKFALSYATRKKLINSGWDFLGLAKNKWGDWETKFGKPVEPIPDHPKFPNCPYYACTPDRAGQPPNCALWSCTHRLNE